MKFFIFSLLLFSSGMSVAQNTLTKEESKELNSLHQEIIGTYQIQVTDSRTNPSMHLSVVRDIMAKRKEKEISFIEYPDKNYRIMILPEETIEKDNFKPLKRIAYIKNEK